MTALPWTAASYRPESLPAAHRHLCLPCWIPADFVSWGPCWLEDTECLEQLRALWHGRRIHVADAVEAPPAGVDTAEDLDRVRRLLGG